MSAASRLAACQTREWLNNWRRQGRTRRQLLKEIHDTGLSGPVPVHTHDPNGEAMQISADEADIMQRVYGHLDYQQQEEWARVTLPRCMSKCMEFAHAVALQSLLGGLSNLIILPPDQE